MKQIINLLKKAEEGEQAKLMLALCFIIEIHENDPKQLSELEQALVKALIKPLVKKIENNIGVEF